MIAHTSPRLHPDWLPPTADPAPRPRAAQPDDPAPTTAHACWHAAAPAAAAIVRPQYLPLAPAPDPDHPHRVVVLPAPETPPAAPPPRIEEGPGERSLANLAAAEDAAEDAEDAELRGPLPSSSDGRMTQLDHSALPLRHRIYALYCEGRSFTAIARTLWLDRGTVARHVHAIEAALLAEQTDTSLAALRLRAIEAQHAILAAAWDALKFEENQEYDFDRERDRDRVEDRHYTPQPGRSRRAQLLAIAARAARTAAQLQGLFTPAALQAALRDRLPAESTMAPAAAAACTGLPRDLNSTDRPLTPSDCSPAIHGRDPAIAPAASCGMPASVPPLPSPPTPLVAPVPGTGLPRELNSRAPQTPLPPFVWDVPCDSIAGPAPIIPSPSRPFAAAATNAVRAAMRAAMLQ